MKGGEVLLGQFGVVAPAEVTQGRGEWVVAVLLGGSRRHRVQLQNGMVVEYRSWARKLAAMAAAEPRLRAPGLSCTRSIMSWYVGSDTFALRREQALPRHGQDEVIDGVEVRAEGRPLDGSVLGDLPDRRRRPQSPGRLSDRMTSTAASVACRRRSAL